MNIPQSTLRSWCMDQNHRANGKTRRFQPLIRLDAKNGRALSFLNLVEAHVFAAIRRQHHVPLPTVRQALMFISKKMGTDRPLAEADFQTDGVDWFLEKLGSLSQCLAGWPDRDERDPSRKRSAASSNAKPLEAAAFYLDESIYS